MEPAPAAGGAGTFEARYLAFIQAVGPLRPRLHRYCARMTGSVLDGEDVVQEALVVAYRRLDAYDESRPLAPWLFRIAHNRCLDFLRRRRTRRLAETAAAPEESAAPATTDPPAVSRAIERLVTRLPPLERACVLLKDVLDHSLEEVAELTGSTVGGVKAALHRGRGKLARIETVPAAVSAVPEIVRLYAERFARRDWDGVRALLADDARLRVADCYQGTVAGSPYFGHYERWTQPWTAAAGFVDGEPVVLFGPPASDGGVSTPVSAVRLALAHGRVRAITDYAHCAWVLPAASVVSPA
jgi:RNA polymerase sigma-70 factor (ECF subfamily)